MSDVQSIGHINGSPAWSVNMTPILSALGADEARTTVSMDIIRQYREALRIKPDEQMTADKILERALPWVIGAGREE